MTAFITLPMSFDRRGAGFGDGRGDGGVDLLGGRGRRQVVLEHGDLGGLLVDKVGAAGLGELLDRVAALLDERRHHLQHFGVVEVVSLFDALVHDRGLEHPQR